jgi:hypothetical protein
LISDLDFFEKSSIIEEVHTNEIRRGKVSTRLEKSRKPKRGTRLGFESLSSRLKKIGIELSVLGGHESEIEYKLIDQKYEDALFALIRDRLKSKPGDPFKKRINKLFLALEEEPRLVCKYSASRGGMIVNLKYDPRSDELGKALSHADKFSSIKGPPRAQ